MKKYYLHTSKHSNHQLGSIREQYDIVSYLLSVMELLNVEPINKIDSRDADLVIFVDKMSRLFWGKGDKIHSIQYPFLLKEKEGFLISLFQGRIIDSQTIAILSTIIGDKDIIKSIENMLDGFMGTMSEFEILDNDYAQFCWELLLYFLSFEAGYLRYDHDDKDKDKVDLALHPVDHIDFFYSSNSTFKVGLLDRIDVEDLKSILNINEKCYSLNYNRVKK